MSCKHTFSGPTKYQQLCPTSSMLKLSSASYSQPRPQAKSPQFGLGIYQLYRRRKPHTLHRTQKTTFEPLPNKKGLEYLRDCIDFLLQRTEPNDVDMMVPEWGGIGLTRENLDPEPGLKIANRVKICNW